MGKKLFTDFACGFPGSMHDAGVLRGRDMTFVSEIMIPNISFWSSIFTSCLALFLFIFRLWVLFMFLLSSSSAISSSLFAFTKASLPDLEPAWATWRSVTASLQLRRSPRRRRTVFDFPRSGSCSNLSQPCNRLSSTSFSFGIYRYFVPHLALSSRAIRSHTFLKSLLSC